MLALYSQIWTHNIHVQSSCAAIKVQKNQIGLDKSSIMLNSDDSKQVHV